MHSVKRPTLCICDTSAKNREDSECVSAGDQAIAAAGRDVPVHRVGRAEEVDAATGWLCSGASSFVIRATIPIDGGKLAGTPPCDMRHERT